MADATQAQLAQRILEKLHVLQAGETPDTADDALVDRVIVSVNEQLRENEIAYWSDSAIPQAVLEPLAAYIACSCAGDFMDEAAAQAFRQSHEGVSLRKLRELTAGRKRFDEPVVGTYF